MAKSVEERIADKMDTVRCDAHLWCDEGDDAKLYRRLSAKVAYAKQVQALDLRAQTASLRASAAISERLARADAVLALSASERSKLTSATEALKPPKAEPKAPEVSASKGKGKGKGKGKAEPATVAEVQ